VVVKGSIDSVLKPMLYSVLFTKALQNPYSCSEFIFLWQFTCKFIWELKLWNFREKLGFLIKKFPFSTYFKIVLTFLSSDLLTRTGLTRHCNNKKCIQTPGRNQSSPEDYSNVWVVSMSN